MAVAFSTQGLDQGDRIPFWVEVATNAFFKHGFSAPAPAFTANLYAGKLENIDLARCDCDPCEVTRSSRDVAHDGVDPLFLCVPLSGRSVVSQGDREVVVDPGSLVLIDASRPMKHNFLTQTASIFVTIPRNALQARIGYSAARMTNISSTAPVAELASGFLSMLVARMDSLEATVRSRVVEQALDLIALAFSDGSENAPVLSSPRATALLRLKVAIDARLSDPGLKPTEAAGAAGISVRYANDLLAEDGSSVERYILHRRLERCRSALADPLQAHRMIGEIAFSWGFSDQSHFTRRFREEFGMTPGDCRRRTQETPLPPPQSSFTCTKEGLK